MLTPLTAQQLIILDRLANSDHTGAEIAVELKLTYEAFRTQCSTIRQLLKVRTDFGAIKKCIQKGIIVYR